MSHDPKCHDLAEYFLSTENLNNEKQVEELAEMIQTVIEDYIDRELEKRL